MFSDTAPRKQAKWPSGLQLIGSPVAPSSSADSTSSQESSKVRQVRCPIVLPDVECVYFCSITINIGTYVNRIIAHPTCLSASSGILCKLICT